MTTAAMNPRVRRGILFYLAFSFVFSWGPAWILSGTWLGESRPLVTRLLTCSLFYTLTMGWQPLLAAWIVRRYIDPPEYLDQGMRPARTRFLLVAGAAPIVLSISAILLAWIFGLLAGSAPQPLQGYAEWELALRSPSPKGLAGLAVAFIATFALVWAQSLGEEIGWRGFFLTRMMQRLGPWRGLCAHGVVWGLWYAPLFMFANADLTRSVFRSVGFLLTCGLLGVLLGWLRLASKSIVPTTVANAALTVAAGLPFLIRDVDIGLRGAAYGPPGWLLMAIAIAVLTAGKCRRAIVTPGSTPREPQFPGLFVLFERGLDIEKRRTLH